MNQQIKNIFETISNELNSEIIVFNNAIDREGANEVIKLTQNPSLPNILFVLSTLGGDPNDAYKIARRLRCKYEKFYLYVCGYCKSAGTLIAIGADELIMSDVAELGPLDVQIPEKDEIFKYSSGLTLEESLKTLKTESLSVFRGYLNVLISLGLTTKTSAKLAGELSNGFINPIASQIDPLRLGETNRAINIATAYGIRLVNQSHILKDQALTRLVSEYPDHGFVIDYEEAKSIFNNVRLHNRDEELMGNSLDLIYPKEKGDIKKIFPSDEFSDKKNNICVLPIKGEIYAAN